MRNEQPLFAHALVNAHIPQARPAGRNRTPALNTIVRIIERKGSLPDWLAFDNPRVHSVRIAKPDRQRMPAELPVVPRTQL